LIQYDEAKEAGWSDEEDEDDEDIASDMGQASFSDK
jgi:hypothetical protein